MRILLIAIIASLALSACGTESSAESELAEPAATTSQAASTTTIKITTTTASPTTTTEQAPTTLATTTTAEPTTTTISEEQLAIATAVGDVSVGEALFNTPVDAVPHSYTCASCHLLDSEDTRNPTLTGISTLAIDRVEGMSAVDYLKQSIMDPYAFKVEGDWKATMPYQYPDALSEEELNDLVAYLLTR